MCAMQKRGEWHIVVVERKEGEETKCNGRGWPRVGLVGGSISRPGWPCKRSWYARGMRGWDLWHDIQADVGPNQDPICHRGVLCLLVNISLRPAQVIAAGNHTIALACPVVSSKYVLSNLDNVFSWIQLLNPCNVLCMCRDPLCVEYKVSSSVSNLQQSVVCVTMSFVEFRRYISTRRRRRRLCKTGGVFAFETIVDAVSSGSPARAHHHCLGWLLRVRVAVEEETLF